MMSPALVVGHPKKVGVAHSRDLDRILKRKEYTLARPLIRLKLEQILSQVDDLAFGHLVVRMPGENLGERALARAVRPHDRVNLTGLHREVEPFENLLSVNHCMQI